jgi:hypothetical protein
MHKSAAEARAPQSAIFSFSILIASAEKCILEPTLIYVGDLLYVQRPPQTTGRLRASLRGGGAHYIHRMIINNSIAIAEPSPSATQILTSGQRLTFWLATCSRDVRSVTHVRKLVHRLLCEYCFSTQRHNPHIALRKRHRFCTLLGLFRSYSTLFVSLMHARNIWIVNTSWVG